jgi:hypothetical protein
MCGCRDQGQPTPVRAPITYRAAMDSRWRRGEVVKLSPSNLLFLSNDDLEVGTEVVVRLTMKVEESGATTRGSFRCRGRIVARTLATWPEVWPAFLVSVCEFVREETAEEAASGG